jgi:putative transposase
MNHNPERHHRWSIRLQGYDYSQAGAYFVTMCAWERECLFGAVTAEGNLQLNECGQIVDEEWLRTPEIRPQVALDAYVIMPNHFHALLVIVGTVGAYCNTPLQKTDSPRLQSPSQTVGAIVRGFKSAATKQINLLRQTPGIPVWQRNYYERVIRDEAELNSTRQYIASNPTRWADDQDNPAVWKNVQR